MGLHRDEVPMVKGTAFRSGNVDKSEATSSAAVGSVTVGRCCYYVIWVS